MKDLVWCTNGVDIYVQCCDQYSFKSSFNKLHIDVSKLHPQIGAQLIGQFFSQYIFLNIDEFDVHNSSTSNYVLDPNCDSFLLKPHVYIIVMFMLFFPH